MKLSKAIEILELECTTHKLKDDPDYLASARLGIEALKMVKAQRRAAPRIIHRPLPGETPEDDAT